jgi:NADH-quinone oxidoreductase subunit N
MTYSDFIALLPILTLAGFALMTMLQAAFFRRLDTAAVLCAGGCVATLGSVCAASSVAPRAVTSLLVIDGYGLFYAGLIVIATAIVAALSYSYVMKQNAEQEEGEEYFVLLLLAALGAVVLTAAGHFVSFFLGLELMSVSLYGLIGYFRARRRPVEAAVKYLILSAASSAFLLFGMALMYFETGTMEFVRLGTTSAAANGDRMFLTGMAMTLVALGFKLAVAPFHMWTPDVYEGAPAPVTAFIATVSKGAVFSLLLRYVTQVDSANDPALWWALSMIAVVSMFTGNLLALLQQNVKRILAYSSIAHLGYLLIAFLAAGPLAVEAVTFYLAAYFVTTLGAFGVVSVFTEPAGGEDARDAAGEAENLEDYRGLFWTRPWLSASLTLMLLSLAGIPLTVGFLGKFYVIAAGVHASLWLLVIALVVNSVIGLFYYLRIVVAMAATTATRSIVLPARAAGPSEWAAVFSLTVLTLLLIGIGIYPDTLIRLIQTLTLA